MNLQDAPWIGNPEYEKSEPEIVTHCAHCGTEIFEGDEYVEYQDGHFCDKNCVMNYIKDEIEEFTGYKYEGEIFESIEDLEEYVEDDFYYLTAELDEGEW